MLQSKLNEGKGPALYLCPNHFLVRQTVEQARQFGIRCVVADGNLPAEFIDGDAIFVTVVHKLFNGLTQFKLRGRSLSVDTVLLDDAHACIDAIKNQFVIALRHSKPNEASAYNEIVELFRDGLRTQGEGSFEDILRHDLGVYLPVPYWDWWDKTSEIAGILSRHVDTDAVRFAWPVLKDNLRHTRCLVSGASILIAPHLPPLDQFGSYVDANHRFFMSATVTDDSFLVKGLGLDPTTVQEPLLDPEETWYGEKMVLLPSLIDEDLSRSKVVETFANPKSPPGFGVVALVPSTKRCADWGKYGARVVDKSSIGKAVEDLRKRSFADTVVVANYYDGIDLPDDACRILIIDSKPFAEDLLERYFEDRRQGSSLIAGRIARVIEQGMGRAVRGEKDYCVILLIGADLIRALQAPGQRDFFSDQTRKQIQLGRQIAQFAREEIDAGADPMKAFIDVANQCLKRDDSWKEWYAQEMDRMETLETPTRDELLRVFQAEVQAERAFQDGDFDQSAAIIQKLLDEGEFPDAEKGWYLQEIARYTYPSSKARSNKLQGSAHKANRSLLRPKEGMIFTKVRTLTPEKRLERIKDWISSHIEFERIATHVDEFLSNLSFGVLPDRFEHALQELATALGFESDRPDKEWKAGPDNLWGLRADEYLLFECKNDVAIARAEINKRETDQMNRSSSWFGRYYPGSKVTRIMIIPPRKVGRSAAFNEEVFIMRKTHLKKLVANTRSFFNEFRTTDLRDLSEARINEHLQTHRLTVDDLIADYSVKPAAYKGP